jgi:peroxiredoxin
MRSLLLCMIVAFVAAGARAQTLTVLTPDGKPAVGALAALAPAGHTLEILNGQGFDDDPAYQRATAGPDGRIQFAGMTEPFLLAVIHSSGYALVHDKELAGQDHVSLRPWGSVAGRRMIGAKPGAALGIVAWVYLGGGETYDPHQPSAMFEGKATTDSQGRFVMACLPEAEVAIGPDNRYSRPIQEIQVQSGKISTVTIGGGGRTVVGRVVIPPSVAAMKDCRFTLCLLSPNLPVIPSPAPPALANAGPPEQAKWWAAFEKTDAAKAYHQAEDRRTTMIQAATYPFDVEADGTIRVQDVAPGAYDLDFEVYLKDSDPSRRLGYGDAQITVPAAASASDDRPVEVPPVPIVTVNDIRIGDMAPDFAVKGLDGSLLRLSDYRGKFVFLEFWATWCGPCLGQTDNLKDLYRACGGDARFVMISLSVDHDPNAPTHYVAKEGLAWKQGFLGESDPVQDAYGLRSIPSFWVIGPDGKVVATPHMDDPLAKIVKAVMDK